ncbi:MAG: PIN/TRAM domain-containing protein [Caldicoprobacter sp.]|uniref:PIN/TRAM domain-containing protein n=1 Tax=Caldicoprobacter sp. TaxID=2004500 RepID=UPI001D46349D|nr:PIN domain nuclease [Clostridia bacterium]
MLVKAFRGALTVCGAVMGIGAAWWITNLLNSQGITFVPMYQDAIVYLLCCLTFAIIVFVFSNKLISLTVRFTKAIEKKLQEMPLTDVILGAGGLIVGLFIAYLISFPLNQIALPGVSIFLTVVIYILLGYLGISVAIKRRDELSWLCPHKKASKDKDMFDGYRAQPKILDTSVIIDGRIFDICKTGFIEGPLIIPSFVLEELRHIADSSDALKRNRGRRGLDILNRIQKELNIPVKIYEKDFDDSVEVDTRLLKVARLLNGKIITNDYNLNKVAEFQGVAVLNINELANAMKPIVLPGEEMVVQVVKDGKEVGQGVAYLDDGTMIVVDGGKKHVGETIGVLVTSVLQTAAGRMIFAKPKPVDKVS